MNDDKADITARLREASTHALMSASRTLVVEAADEIERLREAIRRLADQAATLSVVGGNVIVEMDAALTDAEREAIEWASKTLCVGWHDLAADDKQRTRDAVVRLRGLLDRTQPTHATQREGSVPDRDTIADDTPPDPERGAVYVPNSLYLQTPAMRNPKETSHFGKDARR